MTDMEKDTVDFVPNYDETRTEPTVFPSAFPNLLVNGGTGIAVGMATNIPPHNLGEVIDAICAQIDDPDITLDGLMEFVKGPDFPTGCAILGTAGVRQYLETGHGSMKVRGKAGIEELKGNREQIVITEIPYNVNRATLVERIAELVNDKILSDITAIRDESDENTRVVIELKRDGNPKVVINNLYKHTAMESSFAAHMLAIDHGRPKLLPLKVANQAYIEHRREVVLRRTRFELRKAEERAETLEGYLIALANLDEFIRIIRGSANREEARIKLLAFEFTKKQVEQIGILIRNPARLTEGRYAFSEHQARGIADENADLLDLLFGKLEREQLDSGLVAIGRSANDADEFVEVGERDEITFEGFGAFFGFAQFEAGPSQYHFAAMLDVSGVGFLERKQFWPAVIDRQHDDRERAFHRGVLVEIVDDDLGIGVALELDYHACVFVRFVADRGDLAQNFLIHQIGDALDQRRAVHVERDLGDDDLFFATFDFFNARFAPHFH